MSTLQRSNLRLGECETRAKAEVKDWKWAEDLDVLLLIVGVELILIMVVRFINNAT